MNRIYSLVLAAAFAAATPVTAMDNTAAYEQAVEKIAHALIMNHRDFSKKTSDDFAQAVFESAFLNDIPNNLQPAVTQALNALINGGIFEDMIQYKGGSPYLIRDYGHLYMALEVAERVTALLDGRDARLEKKQNN